MPMNPVPVSLTELELRLNFKTGACDVSRLSDMICLLHLLKTHQPAAGEKGNEQIVIDVYEAEGRLL